MLSLFDYPVIIYSGPLIPTIIVIFIKQLRNDRKVRKILLIQGAIFLLAWIVVVLFWNMSTIEILALPLFSGLLIIIFNFIYIPAKLIIIGMKTLQHRKSQKQQSV
jgi:preprotein translocase subunit SecF